MVERLVGKLYSVIGADQVARAMVSIAAKGYKERIIPNDELRGIK